MQYTASYRAPYYGNLLHADCRDVQRLKRQQEPHRRPPLLLKTTWRPFASAAYDQGVTSPRGTANLSDHGLRPRASRGSPALLGRSLDVTRVQKIAVTENLTPVLGRVGFPHGGASAGSEARVTTAWGHAPKNTPDIATSRDLDTSTTPPQVPFHSSPPDLRRANGAGHDAPDTPLVQPELSPKTAVSDDIGHNPTWCPASDAADVVCDGTNPNRLVVRRRVTEAYHKTRDGLWVGTGLRHVVETATTSDDVICTSVFGIYETGLRDGGVSASSEQDDEGKTQESSGGACDYRPSLAATTVTRSTEDDAAGRTLDVVPNEEDDVDPNREVECMVGRSASLSRWNLGHPPLFDLTQRLVHTCPAVFRARDDDAPPVARSRAPSWDLTSPPTITRPRRHSIGTGLGSLRCVPNDRILPVLLSYCAAAEDEDDEVDDAISGDYRTTAATTTRQQRDTEDHVESRSFGGPVVVAASKAVDIQMPPYQPSPGHDEAQHHVIDVDVSAGGWGREAPGMKSVPEEDTIEMHAATTAPADSASMILYDTDAGAQGQPRVGTGTPVDPKTESSSFTSSVSVPTEDDDEVYWDIASTLHGATQLDEAGHHTPTDGELRPQSIRSSSSRVSSLHGSRSSSNWDRTATDNPSGTMWTRDAPDVVPCGHDDGLGSGLGTSNGIANPCGEISSMQRNNEADSRTTTISGSVSTENHHDGDIDPGTSSGSGGIPATGTTANLPSFECRVRPSPRVPRLVIPESDRSENPSCLQKPIMTVRPCALNTNEVLLGSDDDALADPDHAKLTCQTERCVPLFNRPYLSPELQLGTPVIATNTTTRQLQKQPAPNVPGPSRYNVWGPITAAHPRRDRCDVVLRWNNEARCGYYPSSTKGCRTVKARTQLASSSISGSSSSSSSGQPDRTDSIKAYIYGAPPTSNRAPCGSWTNMGQQQYDGGMGTRRDTDPYACGPPIRAPPLTSRDGYSSLGQRWSLGLDEDRRGAVPPQKRYSADWSVTTPPKPIVAPPFGPGAATTRRTWNCFIEAFVRRHGLPLSSVLDPTAIQFRSTIVATGDAGGGSSSHEALSSSSSHGQHHQRLTLRPINSGTFCTVYEAVVHGKAVAVKCPQHHQLKQDTALMTLRAIKEWRVLDRTRNHSNILSLVGGVILSLEEIWLVTERVPHGDLYARLYPPHLPTRPDPTLDEDHPFLPPLTPATRYSVMAQVAAALMYLHGLSPRIVHKDLKPNNILIDDGYRIRLCDFGDAEEIWYPGDSLKSYTAVTWQYAAPEIILSQDPARPEEARANEKVDIWSFGCVALELCGRPTPFWHLLKELDPACHHPALQSYIMQQGRHPRRAAYAITPPLPKHLHTLVQWCLEFNPGCRPSAQQITYYLTRFKAALIDEFASLEP